MSDACLFLYVGVAATSSYFTSGMLFSDLQSIASVELSQRYEQSDAVMAGVFGTMFSILWPIGVLVVYAMTNKAEHGIWRSKRQQAEQ